MLLPVRAGLAGRNPVVSLSWVCKYSPLFYYKVFNFHDHNTRDTYTWDMIFHSFPKNSVCCSISSTLIILVSRTFNELWLILTSSLLSYVNGHIYINMCIKVPNIFTLTITVTYSVVRCGTKSSHMLSIILRDVYIHMPCLIIYSPM